MVQQISIKQARENFSEIINQIAYGDITYIIKKFNKPLVKMTKFAEEKSNSDNFWKLIKRLQKTYKGINLSQKVIKERDKIYQALKSSK